MPSSGFGSVFPISSHFRGKQFCSRAKNVLPIFCKFLAELDLACKMILIDLCSFIVSQLSFQMWTNQIQETLNSKKLGDSAFHARDFSTAIDCYTQVSQLEILGINFQTSELQFFVSWCQSFSSAK